MRKYLLLLLLCTLSFLGATSPFTQFPDRINSRYYGMFGDSTDVTVKFREMLADAEAAGKSILLDTTLGSKFLLTDSIHVRVPIEGNGAKVYFQLPDSSYAFYLRSHGEIRNMEITVSADSHFIGHGGFGTAINVGHYGSGAGEHDWVIEGVATKNNAIRVNGADTSGCNGIVVTGESYNGVIRNCRVLSSDSTLMGILVHWGGADNVNASDTTYHPHGITIENIQIGSLLRYRLSTGVYLSGTYDVTVRNVHVDSVSRSAVTIFAGDYGFTRYRWRKFNPSSFIDWPGQTYANHISNVKCEYTQTFGFEFLGKPGVAGAEYTVDTSEHFTAVFENCTVEGPYSTYAGYVDSTSVHGQANVGLGDGFSISYSQGIIINNCAAYRMRYGVAVGNHADNVTITNSQFKWNYGPGVYISASGRPPRFTTVQNNIFEWNGRNQTSTNLASGVYVGNSAHTRLLYNRIGHQSDTSQVYGVRVENTADTVTIIGNHVVSDASGAAFSLGTSVGEPKQMIAAFMANTWDQSYVTLPIGGLLWVPMYIDGDGNTHFTGTHQPTAADTNASGDILTWKRGDRIKNYAPGSKSANEWYCTVGGQPGTWLETGPLGKFAGMPWDTTSTWTAANQVIALNAGLNALVPYTIPGLDSAGEINTLSDTGTADGTTGFGLTQTKEGSDLRIRMLTEGSGITMAYDGDTAIEITSTGGGTTWNWTDSAGEPPFWVDSSTYTTHALEADSAGVAGSVDYGDITNFPADLADGDDTATTNLFFDTAAVIDTIQALLTAGGYLTGNETITLSGDVSGSGATSITVTIANSAIDSAMLNATQIDEYIADKVGAMLTGNTETGITVTYDDADNTIDFVVTVSGGSSDSSLSVVGAGTSGTAASLFKVLDDTTWVFIDSSATNQDTLKVTLDRENSRWEIDGGTGLPVYDSMMIDGLFYLIVNGGTDTTYFDTSGVADNDIWKYDAASKSWQAVAETGGSGSVDSTRTGFGLLNKTDGTQDSLAAPTDTIDVDTVTIYGAVGDSADVLRGEMITDHGGLSGLTDDDHTQYLKESDTNAFALALLLSADTAIGESLAAYFDTAGVLDTIIAYLTAAGYLTAETDPTLTDDEVVTIGANAGSPYIAFESGAAADGYIGYGADSTMLFIAPKATLAIGESQYKIVYRGSGDMLYLSDTLASGVTSGGKVTLDVLDGAATSAGHRLGIIYFDGGIDGSTGHGTAASIQGFAGRSDFAGTSHPGRLSFHVTDSGSIDDHARIVINEDGNVGVGTNLTAPSHKLTVAGTVAVTGDVVLGDTAAAIDSGNIAVSVDRLEDSLAEVHTALADSGDWRDAHASQNYLDEDDANVDTAAWNAAVTRTDDDSEILTEPELTDSLTARGFLTSETGDIEGVTANNGVVGGGTSGTVTVQVKPDGTTIDTVAGAVQVDTTFIATKPFVRDSASGVSLSDLNDTLTNYATVSELTNALNTEPVVAGNGVVWGTWGELGYDWDYDINNAWAPNAATADSSIRGPMYDPMPYGIVGTDDSTDNTHFTIEPFPGGFAGYEYWMIFTPLWHFRFENCVIMVRNKGDNWHPWIDSLNGTFDTLPNPVITTGNWYGLTGDWSCDTSNWDTYPPNTNGLFVGHPCFGMADFSFFYEGTNPNRLWIVGGMGFDQDVIDTAEASCSCDSALSFVVPLTYSSSGMAIGDPVVIMPPDSTAEGGSWGGARTVPYDIVGTDTATVKNISPTIHYMKDSTYYMWGIGGTSVNKNATVLLWQNTHFPTQNVTGGSFFSRIGRTDMRPADSVNDKIWHLAVKKAGRNRFVALMDLDAKSSGNGTSKSGFGMTASLDYNGLTWQAAPDNFWEENPKTTAWDGNFGYRSDFYWVRDLHRMYAVMYYSGDSSNATSAGGQTFIYFDPITKEATIRNPETFADTVKFIYVDPAAYPNGIGIKELGFELDDEAAYSLEFQVWTCAHDSAAPTYSSVIDTIVTSATAGKKTARWNTFGDRDYMIAAGSYIYILLPSTDVGEITPRITFYELASPLTVNGSYIR